MGLNVEIIAIVVKPVLTKDARIMHIDTYRNLGGSYENDPEHRR